MFVARTAPHARCRRLHVGLLCCLLLGLAMATSAAHAAMRLNRTRLVIHETQGGAVIQVRSQDANPLLLQTWLSEQADEAGNTPSALPFITDPPVLRLDPGKTRSVQVLMTTPAAALPADRESLFWLNVLETPASAPEDHTTGTVTNPATNPPANPSSQRLFVSFQSQIKVFYRPRTLSAYNGTSALPATDRLRFALERGPDGQAWLTIHNPTPIHQSLASLRLQPLAAEAAPLTLEAPMLSPFEHARLPLPPAAAQTSAHWQLPWQLTFATLNDDGHLIEDVQTLASLPEP